MNQTISQRIAIVHGLRERAALPVQAPRYTVVPRGANTFEVIDRATGKIKGERFGHGNACQFAKQLESSAALYSSAPTFARLFGSTLLRWVALMSACLVLFAHFGVDR